MILTYRHKGLEIYALKGDRSKLQQSHIPKIRLILSRLDKATSPEMMDQPGYNFHLLKGGLRGFYSVKVSENWRIIFRFEDENVIDVDYVDYH